MLSQPISLKNPQLRPNLIFVGLILKKPMFAMHQLLPVEPCYHLISKVLPIVGYLLPSSNQCISMESEIIIASGNNQVDRYKKTILNQHLVPHTSFDMCVLMC
jgi:hypothetical protein